MNILIIDDHQIIKEGVEIRIKRMLPDANCFFTTNVRDGIYRVTDNKIDLVLCDLEFENDTTYDGFDFVKKIRESDIPVKVIAFTTFNSYRVMNKARKSGFDSFLSKGCSFQEFSDTLLNVIDSEPNSEYISLSMRVLMKKRYESQKPLFSGSLYGISNLSENELELVILSAKTTDRNKLAEIMRKSHFTIDSYYKSVLEKLSLKNRSEVRFFAEEFMDELLKWEKQE